MKTYLLVLCVISSTTAMWPTANSRLTPTTNKVALNPSSFVITTDSLADSCVPLPPSILNDAINRYRSNLLFWHHSNPIPSNIPVLPSLSICVQSDDSVPTFETDESYMLSITNSSAHIQAATVFGAMHALETFSQLVTLNSESYWEILSVPLMINDAPYKKWRGLLLDTARRYYSISVIKQLLDSMSYVKMNVFHWHLVDAEAFPFEVPAYPNLSTAGAYDVEAVYTTNDVKDIVTYANARGIRVVPEFDMPGHTDSWGKGYPVTSNCPRLEHNVNNIPLSPAAPNNLTNEVISAVLGHASSLFADQYLHVGGDEVVQSCWREDPAVVAWMHQHNIANTNELYQYFIDVAHQAAIYYDPTRISIHWQEVWDNKLKIPAGDVVQVWKDGEDWQAIVAAGHPVILGATKDVQFYLSKQRPKSDDSVWGFQQTWMDLYNTTVPSDAKVLGVEASQWGEFVNAGSVLANIWVRAAVIGELGWTAPQFKPPFETEQSAIGAMLNDFSCHLRRRGIPSSTVAPGYCLGATA